MAQPSFDSILNAVMLAESGGRRYDDRGNLLTSPKGAQGEMQVMPRTARDPGFGVEPAKSSSPDELARVGRDYLRTMLDRYGSLDKALVAYNWGPKNADAWIAKGADPAKLPDETKKYVSRVQSTLSAQPRTTAQASATPEAAPAAAPARGAPAAAPVRVSEARPADLGPSYQAALALSFLSDEDEKESGRREYDERQPSAASQWLARETRKVTPESLAMPFRSPFAEPEPVKAADGGFIAVGYNQGGEAKTGEWKDGPPPELPPEEPFIPGLSSMRPKERTAKDMLRQAYHSARDFVEDAPLTPMAIGMEGALMLADRYNLMPPHMRQLMGEERARRLARRDLRRQGYEDGGEVEAVASKSTEPPSRPEPFRVPPGQMEARLREFNRLDPATQSLIARDDPRVQFALTPAPASVSAPYTLSTMPGARALYDQTLAGTTTGGYVHPALRMQDRSSLKQIPTQDVVFLRPGRDQAQELQSRAHEAEHLLAKRGLGDATAINDKFDELMKDSRARRAFVEKAVSVQPYLEKTYGTKSTYFMPEMLAFQDKRGRGANLLYEQFAELAAIEQATGKDLTKDPELRKTIFKDKKVREVYNALTGLRQTRLDARDLSPYTPIPEKSDGMMEFIRSKLGFKEGGEAKSEDAPSPEELERASKAAFGIVPSSGKGRKQSRVSDALQSGEAQLAAAKGLTMLPQNMVGAPVDIATMVARPFGYNVEKPVMGSEWLKEKSRAAGLAFQEPEDPTLRAFFTAGDISSNLINPAGATRTAVRGAEKTGEAARALAEFATRPVERDPFLSGPMGAQRGAIRLPGGHFQLERTTDMSEGAGYIDPISPFIQAVYSPTRDKALDEWFNKRVTTYFRRDLGTERDPFVLAAEQGRKTHHALRTDVDMDSPYKIPLAMQEARRAEGMDPMGIAKTPRGQRLEYASDRGIVPSELQDVPSRMIPPGLRQFVETDPTMRLYSLGEVGDLQLGSMKRELFNMRNQGPEYSKHGLTANIPQEYRIPDSALQGLTLDQASERVALFQDWKDKTNQRLAVKAIKQDPDIARTQLSDGSVWAEPPDLIENPRIRDMVLDVGCAGGWCTKDEANAEAYGAIKNRLAILFGSKGSPEAQLTITRNPPDVKDFLRFNPEMQQLFGVTPNQLYSMDVRAAIYRSPQFMDWMSAQPPNMSITEIKGAQNKGNIVDQPYVKKVQEYVQNLDKQYGLLNVENLKGIGLEDLLSHVRNAFPRGFPIREEQIPAIQKEAVRLNGGTRYISVLPDLSSMNELLVQAYKNVTQR